jgi:hypothetical protein
MQISLDLEHNLMYRYTGILQIHEIYSDGNIIIRHAPNVITYDARPIMTYLLAGENLANKYIQFLKVGTVNTAPTRSDTALLNLVDTVGVTYTFSAVDRVVFEGILPNTTSCNGQTLREAGLFNNAGQMLARQVYGDIAKTNAIQLKYIWTIIFT